MQRNKNKYKELDINPKGFIVGIFPSYYEIFVANRGIIKAKALGKFREQKQKIIIGDQVLLENKNPSSFEKSYFIVKIFERKNLFFRPKTANIDNVFIVISTINPVFDEYYLIKLITFCQSLNIKPILIISKTDLFYDRQLLNRLNFYQKSGYQIFPFANSFAKKQLKQIEKIADKKLNLLVGQTGVGKTTILNSLNKNLNLRTQEVSLVLKRGKHTTTNSKIFPIFKNAFFIDTPGFSSLELNLSKIEIAQNFLNFGDLIGKCKYRNCLHNGEEGCALADNFDKISYRIYLKLLFEA